MKDWPVIKKWVLSPHAVARMEEREISLLELAELIHHPDEAVPQGPKWVFSKSFASRKDNGIAAVILERQEKNLWVVVTVMVHYKKRER